MLKKPIAQGGLMAAAAGACLFTLLGGAHVAEAGPIPIGGFSGSETVIDFEGFVSALATGPFVEQGVTFSEASTGTGEPGWRLLTGLFSGGDNIVTDNAGISDFTLDFATAFQCIGLDVGIASEETTYEVSFFDSLLSLLGIVTVGPLNGTADGGFAGFESPSGIKRVRIVETSGKNGHVGGFDDVRFEAAVVDQEPPRIVEPTALGLLGLGLAGLGFARRRKVA